MENLNTFPTVIQSSLDSYRFSRINQDPKDAMLREYQQEIERLSKMVELNKNGSTENAKLSGKMHTAK